MEFVPKKSPAFTWTIHRGKRPPLRLAWWRSQNVTTLTASSGTVFLRLTSRYIHLDMGIRTLGTQNVTSLTAASGAVGSLASPLCSSTHWPFLRFWPLHHLASRVHYHRWAAPPGHDSKMRQTSLSLGLLCSIVSHLMRTHDAGCLDAGSTWTWLPTRSGTGKDAETPSLFAGESLAPYV